jgi:serine/threonine-protein kinase ATR
MFNPFWGNIAIEAVKDLIVKPQTTQVMADLLGISVSEFLILTQSFTLPWLVLGSKIDVIRRISEARKDSEQWMVCMAESNLIPILALLLVQDKADLEDFVMSRFRKVDPRFEELDLVELLRVEPSAEALLLLKAAGEADDGKKSRVGVLESDHVLC